jgi:hypothetical protein
LHSIFLRSGKCRFYDTLTFLTASLIVFSIPFTATLKERVRFCQVVSITAALFTVFALFSSKHNTPLPPVLKTLWFEAHVVLAFLSYALFGIAAILGLLYLRKQESLYEGMQYRAILIGYCLFTLSMIFGGIWAFLAWGTYWLWTPKELWTSILWIYYSFFLHARLCYRSFYLSRGKPLDEEFTQLLNHGYSACDKVFFLIEDNPVVAGLYPRPVLSRSVYYAGDKRVSAYPRGTNVSMVDETTVKHNVVVVVFNCCNLNSKYQYPPLQC